MKKNRVQLLQRNQKIVGNPLFGGNVSCALPERSISPNANEGRQIGFAPVHMWAPLECGPAHARNLPPSDSSAPTMLPDHVCSSSSRRVRSGDWKVVETSIE